MGSGPVAIMVVSAFPPKDSCELQHVTSQSNSYIVCVPIYVYIYICMVVTMIKLRINGRLEAIGLMIDSRLKHPRQLGVPVGDKDLTRQKRSKKGRDTSWRNSGEPWRKRICTVGSDLLVPGGHCAQGIDDVSKSRPRVGTGFGCGRQEESRAGTGFC